MTRRDVIVYNVIRSCLHKNMLTVPEMSFILRFDINYNDEPIFKTASMYGTTVIPVEEITEDHFNKLHRLAYLSER